MTLADALAQSQPCPPTQQMARTILAGQGAVSVASDGRFWDVLWLGSPFGFETQPAVEAFLAEEGISRQEGWMPQVRQRPGEGGRDALVLLA